MQLCPYWFYFNLGAIYTEREASFSSSLRLLPRSAEYVPQMEESAEEIKFGQLNNLFVKGPLPQFEKTRKVILVASLDHSLMCNKMHHALKNFFPAVLRIGKTGSYCLWSYQILGETFLETIETLWADVYQGSQVIFSQTEPLPEDQHFFYHEMNPQWWKACEQWALCKK
jgi:hypothetical protein